MSKVDTDPPISGRHSGLAIPVALQGGLFPPVHLREGDRLKTSFEFNNSQISQQTDINSTLVDVFAYDVTSHERLVDGRFGPGSETNIMGLNFFVSDGARSISRRVGLAGRASVEYLLNKSTALVGSLSMALQPLGHGRVFEEHAPHIVGGERPVTNLGRVPMPGDPDWIPRTQLTYADTFNAHYRYLFSGLDGNKDYPGVYATMQPETVTPSAALFAGAKRSAPLSDGTAAYGIAGLEAALYPEGKKTLNPAMSLGITQQIGERISATGFVTGRTSHQTTLSQDEISRIVSEKVCWRLIGTSRQCAN